MAETSAVIDIRRSADRGTTRTSWLTGRHSFSFDLSLPKTSSAVWSSGTTLVPMMGSPDFGERDDLSKILAVDRSPFRCVLLER